MNPHWEGVASGEVLHLRDAVEREHGRAADTGC